MNMLWKMVEPKYQANSALSRALDILFILHADHEQNCSTNVMRAVAAHRPTRSLPPPPLPPHFPVHCMEAPTKRC
jgi:hypothetical protein